MKALKRAPLTEELHVPRQGECTGGLRLSPLGEEVNTACSPNSNAWLRSLDAIPRKAESH